jgi:agmatine/peptidylarginine deiminase
MLTWPHGETDWADDLDAVEGVYVRIAHGIAAREAVLIVCQTNAHRAHVSGLLDRAEVPRQRVVWATSPSNDTWARDHGPLTVIDAAGTARILDFRFNGWGGKLKAGCDDRITGTLHAQGVFGPAKHSKVDLVLEGGAVETDGEGTLLATLSSVVTETRNPGLSLEAIERRLAKLLGIDRFLWLRHGGLSGDDTDGHIDTLARFADPATILHVSCAPQDPDYPEITAMIRELEGFRTPDGRPYRLVALPAPVDHRDVDGRRLAASYANFLIIDGAVLVPVYGDPADDAAVRTISGCFPGRRAVPIDCRPLIRQNGSLHCVTMQLPAALSLRSAPVPA